MSEVSHRIPVESFFLEALYEEGRSPETVVVCHPHPLYGGSMDNNVISAMMKPVRDRGWGTLRFNFRGVGESGGKYGEGEGEVADVLAVASYLVDHGIGTIHLAGYSFGAWIALKAIQKRLPAASLILASPPLDLLPFRGLVLPAKPCLMTLGDSDGFCSVRSLTDWIASQPYGESFVELDILSGCDHFYWGHEETLSRYVAEFLEHGFK